MNMRWRLTLGHLPSLFPHSFAGRNVAHGPLGLHMQEAVSHGTSRRLLALEGRLQGRLLMLFLKKKKLANMVSLMVLSAVHPAPSNSD